MKWICLTLWVAQLNTFSKYAFNKKKNDPSGSFFFGFIVDVKISHDIKNSTG